MSNTKIVSHHVGGRGAGLASVALPIAPAFAPDIVNILYDADPDCVVQTQNWWDTNSKTETKVYPYCLWKADEPVTFHLTYDPFAASVFPTNPEFANYYLPFRGQDYLFGDATVPMETRTVPGRSLDSLIANDGLPTPDFLSLDTQGSEFEILTGAANAVRNGVVALKTELAFAEAYKGQTTFPALHSWLLDNGFIMFDMEAQGYSPHRGPLGARGKALPLFGDALYLRRLDTVPTGSLGLYKLAAIAAWFGHVEYALAALARADQAGDGFTDISYVKFLREMASAVAALPYGMPKTFKELMTFEKSRARFSPEYVVKVRNPYRSRMQRLLTLDVHPLRKLQNLREDWRLRNSQTPLEALFIRYGFADVADILKQRRLFYGIA